jgi:hypothetical protein
LDGRGVVVRERTVHTHKLTEEQKTEYHLLTMSANRVRARLREALAKKDMANGALTAWESITPH